MNFSEKKYINGVTTFCYTIINAILCVAYILEFLSDQRTLGYLLGILAFTIIPSLLCWIFYKKAPETTMCKHIMGYSYGAFYLFILFTLLTKCILGWKHRQHISNKKGPGFWFDRRWKINHFNFWQLFDNLLYVFSCIFM